MDELKEKEDLLKLTFDIAKQNVSILISENKITEENVNDFYNNLQDLNNVKEEILQEKIKNMSVPATTLDKEKERLEILINNIEEMLQEQRTIYSEYSEITGKSLKPTQNEERNNDLLNMKDRLKTIDEFINNRTELNKLNASIEDDKAKLSTALSKKKEYDNVNLNLNGELFACFSAIVKAKINQQEELKKNDQQYSIFYDKLLQRQLTDEIISDVKRQVKTYSENLVILKRTNKVENNDKIRRKSFQCYEAKEKLLLLDIYNEILISDSNNIVMTDKRKKISEALAEIRKMRIDYNVSKEVLYDDFKKVNDEQIEKISVQSQNEANIDFLNNTIGINQEKIGNLKVKMNTGPIVSILQGFNRSTIPTNLE